MANTNEIKVGDYVVTTTGYAGNVIAVGTGNMVGIITIGLSHLGPGKGISVWAYKAVKATFDPNRAVNL